MAKTLDKHFKCPKSLKTMFALQTVPGSLRKSMMAAQAHADSSEYATMTQLVPLPKPPGEKTGKPKKKFGAEKYDQPKKAA